MGSVDKRGRLEEEVFSYTPGKDKVFISYRGKQVTVLKGEKRQVFLRKIAGADRLDAQLIMAKATGNFKRGNEKNRKG